MSEGEDHLVFAVVPFSVVTKNYIHVAGGFVHETYSNARKLATNKGAWGDGKAVRTMKVIHRRIYKCDVIHANGQLQIVRSIPGWEDIKLDDHQAFNAEDVLGGRKGLA